MRAKMGFLTMKERKLLRKTWEGIEDRNSVGAAAYLILFKRKPAVKQLFAFKLVPDDSLPTEPRFLRQVPQLQTRSITSLTRSGPRSARWWASWTRSSWTSRAGRRRPSSAAASSSASGERLALYGREEKGAGWLWRHAVVTAEWGLSIEAGWWTAFKDALMEALTPAIFSALAVVVWHKLLCKVPASPPGPPSDTDA